MIEILDSTLRDGSQAQGISFSVSDKVRIVETLDELGVSFIEAGNPSSNPKDREFFEKAKDLKLKNSQIVAFGSTILKSKTPDTDENFKVLKNTFCRYVAIFGKTWDFQATDVLGITLDENLKLIKDSILDLVKNKKEVIFDAEHFFDGYKSNPNYAIKCLQTAYSAGAKRIVLCDTRGASFPWEISGAIKDIKSKLPKECIIGIHAHNDEGFSEAISLEAYRAGATHIQGTLLGFGERCGNANLSAIIPALQIKLKEECIKGDITKLCDISYRVAEISNVGVFTRSPYIGSSAFAHKAGMHIDGVIKSPTSFEHLPPESIGAKRKFLISEVAGRSTIVDRIAKWYPEVKKTDEIVVKMSAWIKQKEAEGFSFEGSQATVDLEILRQLKIIKPYFTLLHYKILSESLNYQAERQRVCSAIVKVKVGEKEAITAEEGNGPVNALDSALRSSLEKFYPVLKKVRLKDYKVRVTDSGKATGSAVRVIIESTDNKRFWATVGAGEDVIRASWLALRDSYEYCLAMEELDSKTKGKKKI